MRNPGYWFGRQGVRIGLATVGIRYRVAGAEHVRGSRPSVYCVNHTSNLEPPIVYMALRAVHPKLRILYKAELQKLPLLPAAFAIAGFVPIDRRNREHSRAAIDTAAAALRAGFSFLVFPEGTRSRSGALLPFKKGGFVMAIRGGAAVVPLTILGAGQAMHRGSQPHHPARDRQHPDRPSHRVPAVRFHPARRADRGHPVGDGRVVGGRSHPLTAKPKRPPAADRVESARDLTVAFEVSLARNSYGASS